MLDKKAYFMKALSKTFTAIPVQMEYKASTTERIFTPKFLLMDRSSAVTSVMRHHLKVNFPNANIDIMQSPEVLPGYDVYFIGEPEDEGLGVGHLMESARRMTSGALVIAMDGAADAGGGPVLTYNKRSPIESKDTRDAIRDYLDTLESRKGKPTGNPLLEFAKSFNRRSKAAQ